MKMNYGAQFVKYILFLFNFFCLLAGILLIVFGSLLLSNNGSILKIPDVDLTDFPKAIPIAAIILGCVVSLISFLGCCGALKENNCMTMMYSIAMLILLAIQITFIVILWVKQHDIINIITKSLEEGWNEQVSRSSENGNFNSHQPGLKCCGKTGPDDYEAAGLPLPSSCCEESASTCTSETAFKLGCKDALENWLQLNLNIIKFGCIGVAAIELIAVIFSCCLAGAIRDSRRA